MVRKIGLETDATYLNSNGMEHNELCKYFFLVNSATLPSISWNITYTNNHDSTVSATHDRNKFVKRKVPGKLVNSGHYTQQCVFQYESTRRDWELSSVRGDEHHLCIMMRQRVAFPIMYARSPVRRAHRGGWLAQTGSENESIQYTLSCRVYSM